MNKVKKAYIVNPEKKIVIIDDEVKATAAENKDIDRYVAAGYVIRHKSKKRAAKAAERADKISDAMILEALKGDKKALDKYVEIKKTKGKGGGFFAAKKWYKENYQK